MLLFRDGPSSLLASGSHPCICDCFSITGNQRRDYYDSIQCALMVGGNLPPNHAIAVINLLSAPLSRAMRQSPAWKAQSSPGKNGKKINKNISKGKRVDWWDWWRCVWWIRRQHPFTEASECEWVFFLHNIVLKQQSKKRTSGEREKKRGSHCSTHIQVWFFIQHAVIVAIYFLWSFSQRSLALYLAIN